MKDIAYLILNQNGIIGMRKTAPPLEGGQIAVRVHVEAPASVFRNAYPEARITIGDEHVMLPVPAVTLLPADPDGK